MKLGRHDLQMFVLKSGVAIFDLGPGSKVIEVSIHPIQPNNIGGGGIGGRMGGRMSVLVE